MESRARFSIFKRSSDKTGKNSPFRIKIKDGEGRWRTLAGCNNKRATERRAKRLEAEFAPERAGLHDRQETRRREQRRRPLTEHPDDYHRAILAKNGTAKNDASKHANAARTYVNRTRLARRLVVSRYPPRQKTPPGGS